MRYILILILFLGCELKEAIPPPTVEADGNVNYIVLESSLDSSNKVKGVRVAFYLPVADSSNFVGVSYRFIALQIKPTVTQVGFLDGPLSDSLSAGIIFEKIETIEFNADLTKVQKRNIIDARWSALVTQELPVFYARYDFWGLERIVP